MLIRRVVGHSMTPLLKPDHLVIALRLRSAPAVGEVVIFKHDGLDKIKRITKVAGNKIYLEGDNKKYSRDSREFGWLSLESIAGKVIWPRL